VIVNQTKAFEFMFEHGHKYGEGHQTLPRQSVFLLPNSILDY
jgi:hypothetical protein